MKFKAFFVVLLLFLIPPAFSIEEAKDTVNPDVEVKEQVETKEEETETSRQMFFPSQNSRPRLRNAASVRPKREHLKTKMKAEADLAKNKQAFEKRVNNELMLLRDEQEVLEYCP